MHKLLLTVLSIYLMASCTKKADLGDFNQEQWKNDPNGCLGERAQMVDDIREAKSKLLGLYQKSIIKVLGRPEQEELYKRSQTYYIYAIDPSKECSEPDADPRFLRIRFTSLGIANEVNIR